MKCARDIRFSKCSSQFWLKYAILLAILFSIATTITSTENVEATDDAERQALIQVLVVVPTILEENDVIHVLPEWMEGEELLPGGTLAQKEINNLSSFLDGYKLELIPIYVPFCEYHKGIVQFVDQITSIKNNIIAVVGYFCLSLGQQLSKLLRNEPLKVLQISSIPWITQDNDFDSDVQSIVSLSEPSARAAVQLIKKFEWSRVAVVWNLDLNNIYSKDVFIKLALDQGINVTVQLEISWLSHHYLKSAVFDQLINSGIKIVVVFVFPSEALNILCGAYIGGLMWPDYAWIFIGGSSSQRLLKANCSHYSVKTDVALNNSIFLHPFLHSIYDFDALPSGLNYGAYIEELERVAMKSHQSFKSNQYANLLYDSVWAVALTLNRSLGILDERKLSLGNISQARDEIFDLLKEQLPELSFQGATGFLNFSLQGGAVNSSVNVVQFQNGQQLQLGVYVASSSKLYFNDTAMRKVPSDVLSHVYVLYPLPVTIIITLILVVCFVLTAVSMFFFFYYRNEPSIKATSSTLSIYIFIGSYLLLASSLTHSLASGISIQRSSLQFRTFVCTADVGLFGVGIDIISATIIAKTLRIYHIFKTFGKVHKICSNLGLSVLISVIVFLKIILFALWVSLDPPTLTDNKQLITTSVPPHLLIVQACTADYYTVWLIAYFAYSTVLGLAMVLLAILTRKIKRSDYKDSKKINMLVAVLIVDMCLASILWNTFRASGSTIVSRLSYGTGIMLAAIFCQTFLILPKILPLVSHNIRCLNFFKKKYKKVTFVSATQL